MRTLLGVFMVLFVSGDDEMIEITGVIEESVLLPCNCSERNLDKLFKWQMEKPKETLVLTHNMSSHELYGRYKDRVQIFLPENSNNCSILLTSITAADLGKYRCSFHKQEKYKKAFVSLNISASYNVCQKNISSNLFQCDVKGHYEEADIQWTLNGQLLTDSTTTRITHAKTLNATSRLYHFTSNLTIKLNSTSTPKCDVNAKGLSTIIKYDCKAVLGKTENITQPKEFTRQRYVIIIPLSIFVLVICLVQWHHQKRSQKAVEGSEEQHNLVVMA